MPLRIFNDIPLITAAEPEEAVRRAFNDADGDWKVVISEPLHEPVWVVEVWGPHGVHFVRHFEGEAERYPENIERTILRALTANRLVRRPE